MRACVPGWCVYVKGGGRGGGKWIGGGGRAQARAHMRVRACFRARAQTCVRSGRPGRIHRHREEGRGQGARARESPRAAPSKHRGEGCANSAARVRQAGVRDEVLQLREFRIFHRALCGSGPTTRRPYGPHGDRRAVRPSVRRSDFLSACLPDSVSVCRVRQPSPWRWAIIERSARPLGPGSPAPAADSDTPRRAPARARAVRAVCTTRVPCERGGGGGVGWGGSMPG